MDINLKKANLSCYKPVFEGRSSCEESVDQLVPDVMPDIDEIILANGSLMLRSKEIHAGKLTLSGSVQACVLFRNNENPALEKLNVEFPYSISIEDNFIEERCLASASAQLCYIDARALNPRKIQLRAGLSMQAVCYIADTAEIAFACDDECALDLYTKTECAVADTVTGVYEKTFILTDELILSGNKTPITQLLDAGTALSTEEVRFINDKMIFKGNLRSELLWCCEDGSIHSATYNSPFSQIMETKQSSENANAELRLMLTGAYIELMQTDSDSKRVSVEVHVLAQAVCSEQAEITYIADAYSNSHRVELCHAEPLCLYEEGSYCKADSMRGQIETPFQVSELLQATAEIGVWTSTAGEYACPIYVKLLLRDDAGELHGIVRSFNAKWDACDEGEYTFALREIRCTELHAAVTTQGVEVQLTAEACGVRRKRAQITPVSDIKAEPESRENKQALPSLVVLPKQDCDYWALAKRYHSSVELIKNANYEYESEMLLIPKAR